MKQKDIKEALLMIADYMKGQSEHNQLVIKEIDKLWKYAHRHR